MKIARLNLLFYIIINILNTQGMIRNNRQHEVVRSEQIFRNS